MVLSNQYGEIQFDFRPQKIINKNKDKYPVTLVLSTFLPFPLSVFLCV